MENFNTKELVNRWIEILRHKADYDHKARAKGETVTVPDIDEICNEMLAYFTGVVTK